MKRQIVSRQTRRPVTKVIRASRSVDIFEDDYNKQYEDVGGGVGNPGDIYSLAEIKKYWNKNNQDDPVLEEYRDYYSWWKDTRYNFMSEVKGSRNITAAEDFRTFDAFTVDEVEEMDPNFRSWCDDDPDTIEKFYFSKDDECPYMGVLYKNGELWIYGARLDCKVSFEELCDYMNSCYNEGGVR